MTSLDHSLASTRLGFKPKLSASEGHAHSSCHTSNLHSDAARVVSEVPLASSCPRAQQLSYCIWFPFTFILDSVARVISLKTGICLYHSQAKFQTPPTTGLGTEPSRLDRPAAQHATRRQAPGEPARQRSGDLNQPPVSAISASAAWNASLGNTSAHLCSPRPPRPVRLYWL